MAIQKKKLDGETEMMRLMLLGALCEAPDEDRAEIEGYRKQIIDAFEASVSKDKFTVALTLAHLDICGE
jgi:hypothetical protein